MSIIRGLAPLGSDVEAPQRFSTRAVFAKYSTDGKSWSKDDLGKFLIANSAPSKVNPDYVNQLWKSKSPGGAPLTPEIVVNILFDEELTGLHARTNRSATWQDMRLSLNGYYVRTAQYVCIGRSPPEVAVPSLEYYEEALLAGVRCVDVDIYDGPYGPVVDAGFGPVEAALPLGAVFATIAQHAFTASHFPVIVMMRVHCSEANMRATAAAADEAFGSSLRRPFGLGGDELGDPLFTPAGLRKRILLAGPVGYLDAVGAFAQPIPARAGEPAAAGQRVGVYDPVPVELSSVIALPVVPVPPTAAAIGSLAAALDAQRCLARAVVLSDAEEKRIVADGGAAALQTLSRTAVVYVQRPIDDPSVPLRGTEPFKSWANGASCVAAPLVNGAFSRLSTLRFRDNGQCGWLLKPAVLRLRGREFKLTKQYSVQVCLVAGVPPGARVQVRGRLCGSGGASDWQTTVAETASPKGAAAFPLPTASNRSASTFTFACGSEQLDMLYFDVTGIPQPNGAPSSTLTNPASAVPITSIRTGYRALRLRDPAGARTSTAILFRVSSVDVAPSTDPPLQALEPLEPTELPRPEPRVDLSAFVPPGPGGPTARGHEWAAADDQAAPHASPDAYSVPASASARMSLGGSGYQQAPATGESMMASPQRSLYSPPAVPPLWGEAADAAVAKGTGLPARAMVRGNAVAYSMDAGADGHFGDYGAGGVVSRAFGAAGGDAAGAIPPEALTAWRLDGASIPHPTRGQVWEPDGAATAAEQMAAARGWAACPTAAGGLPAALGALRGVGQPARTAWAMDGGAPPGYAAGVGWTTLVAGGGPGDRGLAPQVGGVTYPAVTRDMPSGFYTETNAGGHTSLYGAAAAALQRPAPRYGPAGDPALGQHETGALLAADLSAQAAARDSGPMTVLRSAVKSTVARGCNASDGSILRSELPWGAGGRRGLW